MLPREHDWRAQLRQHEGEFLLAGRIERQGQLGEQRAQQPRLHGVGDVGIAGPGAQRDDAVATGAELLQQPALADSRFADEQEGASRRPRVVERHELALAADQPRWPDKAGRHDGAARRSAVPPRSIVASSSIVSADGGVPCSSFRRASKRP